MNVAHQSSAIDQALAQPSLSAAFLAQAAASPGRVALRAFGSPRRLTMGEWSARATAVAGGLVRLGVRPGDRVAANSDPVPGADDRSDRDLPRPLAALTGLEQAHFLAVAGAPSSPEMLAELTAFGLPINEFYGSSETIVVTCSPPDRIRLGTVGTPLAGARLRLGEDGRS